MTKNDEQLIKRAWLTPATHWGDIENLEQQAESEEAKKKLKSIKVRKFSME